jgi:hypothetical protein
MDFVSVTVCGELLSLRTFVQGVGLSRLGLATEVHVWMQDYAEAVALSLTALDAAGILAVQTTMRADLPSNKASSGYAQNILPASQGEEY